MIKNAKIFPNKSNIIKKEITKEDNNNRKLSEQHNK